MKHIQWITEQMNKGKTWDELKNLTEEDFIELREYQGIIPLSIKNLQEWKKVVEDREKVYVDKKQATGISVNDPLNLAVPNWVTSSWKAYKESLKGTMTDNSIQDVEESSHWILNQLTRNTGIRKGLVMGSVQSGKTANMVGLASMAADYDWNFFIILSGSIDNLRIQTRDRFKKDLKNTDSVQWHVLDYGSDKDHLYDSYSGKQIALEELKLNALGKKDFAEKYVMVCLKQSGRLERLIKWLHSNQAYSAKLRLIVIDDEADQASVNTRFMENAVDEEPENDVERTKINESIVRMVSNCLASGIRSSNPLQSINYLSYTATPYANILNEKIDGYSLYPSDFIFSLPEPKAYFGEKIIFGSHSNKEAYPGLNIIRQIDAEELKKLNSSKVQITSIPQGLEKAIKWFFCAAAVMRLSPKKRPISMLIHTSPRVKIHMIEYKLVLDWLRNVNKDKFISECEAIYEEEIKKFTKEDLIKAYADYDFKESLPDKMPAFEKISNDIRNILSTITHIALDEDDDFEYVENGVHLCVDNCTAQRYAEEDVYMRVAYPDEETLSKMSKSPVFIVFGGNTLSRGLTIEGLVCTYFARNVTQADTLMQMARWFGYRKGYELLQRIWLSDESKKHFELLQQIDEELKKEFNDFVKEKKSPKEFGPKVLNSNSVSKLKITAKSKMQAAVETGGGYQGDAFETTKFREDDLPGNIYALESLVKEIGRAPVDSEHSSKSLLWRDVGSGIIFRFLSDYKHYDDKQERIIEIIKKANTEGKYLNWNVVIVTGDSNTENATWKPYGDYSIKKSMRSKVIGEPDIDIARLRNSTDALCDVKVSDLADWQKVIYEEAKDHCRPINASRGKLGLADNPLLLIYRIDKYATKAINETRESIKTKEDIIAYAIIISGDGKDDVGPSTLSII